MTRTVLIAFLVVAAHTVALAQVDSLPTANPVYAQIKEARNEVLTAFIKDDRPGAQFWLDSLERLRNDRYTTTAWDERWLLYHWLGMYEVLFREVSEFGLLDQAETENKGSPPSDSLFEKVDERMFERRLELFDGIRQQMLSEEERLFVILHLEYLLRFGIEGKAREEQDLKIQAFMKSYPKTRFRNFIQNYMYFGYLSTKHVFGLDFYFLNGNWTDELERSISPLLAFQGTFSFWFHRASLFGGITAGGSHLERPVFVRNFEWPEEEEANYVDLFAGAGFDVLDTRRLRITPNAAIGLAILWPPEPGDPDNPLPAYYDEFTFSSLTLRGGLHADLKFGKNRDRAPYAKNENYNGVRLSMGYQRLNFGRKTVDMAGNMLYFAVGITFNSRPLIYHKL